MYISKTKTKNTTTYYLVKSFKDPNTGKISTKTIERIGNTEEIKDKINGKDINKWLKDYAKKKTEEEKDKTNPKVSLTFNKSKKIDRHKNIKNAGYIYLKKACEQLGLKRICSNIAKQEHLKFDLYQVATHIIYNIIFDSNEYQRTSIFHQELVENINYKNSDVAESLHVLVKYGIDIQKMLYKYLRKNLNIDNTKLFYSCNNYSDINYQIYNFNNSEMPQNIITFTKVFFDNYGFPCMYISDNNANRKYKNYESVQKFIKSNFGEANLYVLPDSVYSATDSIMLNQFKNKQKISNQNVANFNMKLLNWATDPTGWRKSYSNKTFNIDKLEQTIRDIKTPANLKTRLQSQIFYKYKKVNISIPGTNKSIPQYMILMYNYVTKIWLKQLRENQFKNFNEQDEQIVEQYKKAFKNSEAYDGYFAVCLNSDEDIVGDILNVLTSKFEQLDFMLRYVKNDFTINNVLSQEEAIDAHYLTTFISLTIFKYITHKLNNKFTNEEVVETLKKINFSQVGCEGWIPVFTPDEITDALKEAFDVDFDFEFITANDMKNRFKS